MTMNNQRITRSDPHFWHMFDADHSMTSNPSRGSASLEIRSCCDGSLDITATEPGSRAKIIGINLKPDAVQSLIEWFKAYAQEPVTNGGDERPPTELPPVANNPESPLP